MPEQRPDPSTIVLPAELRPGDGRFGSGPSKVRPEAVAALADASTTWLGTSHRREEVRSVVRGRVFVPAFRPERPDDFSIRIVRCQTKSP